MSLRADEGYRALTEKEKATLRLIARGHDAKSTARSLGLSVHTINERLRDARRKMAVSSSREAARLLADAEGTGSISHPQSFGDMEIGEDARRVPVDQGTAPLGGVRRTFRRPLIIGGALLMLSALGLSALIVSAQLVSSPVATPAAAVAVPMSEAAETARQWLGLLDERRWDATYRGTSASFREQNTAEVWAKVSEEARTPLGAMVSRTFVSQENLPAPPDGYEVVKFRTRFANRETALETVTLRREDGQWRVAGVMID
jgi:DNA-binding CsgD family transcriptional regulator